jgi:hypothetical protein
MSARPDSYFPHFARDSFLETNTQSDDVFDQSPNAGRVTIPSPFIDFAMQASDGRFRGHALIGNDTLYGLIKFQRHVLELIGAFGLLPRPRISLDPSARMTHAEVLSTKLSISVSSPTYSFFRNWDETVQLFTAKSQAVIFLLNSVTANLPQVVTVTAGLMEHAVIIVVFSWNSAVLLFPRDFRNANYDHVLEADYQDPPFILVRYAIVAGRWVPSPSAWGIQLAGLSLLSITSTDEYGSGLRNAVDETISIIGYIGPSSKVAQFLTSHDVKALGSEPVVVFLPHPSQPKMVLYLPAQPGQTAALPSSAEFLEVAAHATHFMRGCCSSVVFLHDDGNPSEFRNPSFCSAVPPLWNEAEFFGHSGRILLSSKKTMPYIEMPFYSMTDLKNWLLFELDRWLCKFRVESISLKKSITRYDDPSPTSREINGEIFAFIRQVLRMVRKPNRVLPSMTWSVTSVIGAPDCTVSLKLKECTRTSFDIGLVVPSSTSSHDSTSVEKVVSLWALDSGFHVVGAWPLADSTLILMSYFGELLLYHTPFGWQASNLPPPIASISLEFGALKPDSFICGDFCEATHTLVFFCDTESVLLEFDETFSKINRRLQVDSRSTFAPLVGTVENKQQSCTLYGIVLSETDETGVIVYNRKSENSSKDYIVVFSTREFAPIRTFSFAWSGIQDRDLSRAFLYTPTQRLVPVRMRNSELDLVLVTSGSSGKVIYAYLQCDISSNKIVPIKHDCDFLELPKTVIDLPSPTVFFCGDEPRLFGKWDECCIGAQVFVGNREPELFGSEAIIKVYTETRKRFGIGELWAKQVGGTPHRSLSVLGHLSRELIRQAESDLKESITFSEVDRSFTGGPVSLIPCVLRLGSAPRLLAFRPLPIIDGDFRAVFDRREAEYELSEFTRHTCHLPCLAIAEISLTGHVLSDLTGLAFLNFPATSLAVGATLLANNDRLSHIVASLFTINTIPFRAMALVAAVAAHDLVIIRTKYFVKTWRAAVGYADVVVPMLGIDFPNRVTVIVIANNAADFTLLRRTPGSPGDRFQRACELVWIAKSGAAVVREAASRCGGGLRSAADALPLLRRSAALFGVFIDRGGSIFEHPTVKKPPTATDDPVSETEPETDTDTELAARKAVEQTLSNPTAARTAYDRYRARFGHCFPLYRAVLLSCDCGRSLLERASALSADATTAPELVYETYRDAVLASGTGSPAAIEGAQRLVELLLGNDSGLSLQRLEAAGLMAAQWDTGFGNSGELASLILGEVAADESAAFAECAGDVARAGAREHYARALALAPENAGLRAKAAAADGDWATVRALAAQGCVTAALLENRHEIEVWVELAPVQRAGLLARLAEAIDVNGRAWFTLAKIEGNGRWDIRDEVRLPEELEVPPEFCPNAQFVWHFVRAGKSVRHCERARAWLERTDAALALVLLEQFYFRAEGDPVRETPALLHCLVKEGGKIHRLGVAAAVGWLLEGEHTREIEIKIESAWEEMSERRFDEEEWGEWKMPRVDQAV